MNPAIPLLIFAVAAGAPDGKVQDRPVHVSARDKEMNEAIDRARATLDGFLKIYAHPPRGADDFRLKVKVTDANGSEHLWIEPFKITASGFSGVVSNVPDTVESVAEGDTIEFQRGEITDWGYVQDGKQKGGFTVCVMFKHMGKDEADAYRRDYGFEC